MDLLSIVAKAMQPIPDELYDNGLNVRCAVCGCWVSKKFVKNGKCPGCKEAK